MITNELDNKLGEMIESFSNSLDEIGVEKLFLDPEGLQKALGISGQQLEQLYHESDFCYEHQEWENALACLYYLIAIEPRKALHSLRLGSVFMQLNKAKDALPALQMSAVLNPEDPRPFLYMGSCYLQLGDFVHAKESFETCLQVAHTSPLEDRAEVETLAYSAMKCIQ